MFDNPGDVTQNFSMSEIAMFRQLAKGHNHLHDIGQKSD